MRIVSERAICETLIEKSNESILDAYDYKRLLNKAYKPDEYLFFQSGKDVLPLVAKNRVVTFYGGRRFNYATRLPHNPELINAALRHLAHEGYRFQLVSISNDPFTWLDEDNRSFDTPFTVEWHYRDIRHYDPDSLLHGRTGKRLWSWNRLVRNKKAYAIETLDFETFASRFEVLMQAHQAYFQGRGKTSVWSGAESLLLEILEGFERTHRLVIRLIAREGDWRAVYAIVHNHSELIYYFGSSLNSRDHYVSKVMFLDLLEQARSIASARSLDMLNGLTGAFSNKRLFGFTPSPLFALVNDPDWVHRPDPDILSHEQHDVYGRTFGIGQ